MDVKGFLMVGIQCTIMLLAFSSPSLSWIAFARSLNVTQGHSMWLFFSLGQSTLRIIFLTNLLTFLRFKYSQHTQALLEYEMKPSKHVASPTTLACCKIMH